MAIALSLPTLALSDDERSLIDFHVARLLRYRQKNRLAFAYYEGRQRVRNLGVNLPASLRDVDSIVGWPALAVDVLEERLDWQGWTSETGDVLGLDRVYTDNGLDVDGSLGHLDALIAGIGFVIVGTGFDGEPDPLVTVESANSVTGEWDGRIRRLSSALSIDEEEAPGNPDVLTLYTPDEDLKVVRGKFGWAIAERDPHGLGRTRVAALPNRPRSSRAHGRSEISRALRSHTDAAVRALLGMDVHREFFQAPQRYLLGAEEAMFKKGDGSTATGWETVMGRMLAIPRDENDDLPTIGQFAASSPEPYLALVRGLAQMVSAEAAIPANYLGFTSENPPSADAIRAMESRLVKRAERRQALFGRGWREVAALALLVRDGEIPDEFASIRPDWRDAATPTRTAAADEVTKYVGAGVLPADSEVTYDRMGLSPAEKRTLAAEKRRADAKARLDGLAAAAAQARAQAPAPAAPEAPVEAPAA